MSRRAGLPAADELFRRTSPGTRPLEVVADEPAQLPAESADPASRSAPGGPATAGVRHGEMPDTSSERLPGAPSGRERHAEKITVYVTAAELVDLERARLTLRAEHGLGVDRGRIVREALAVVLADLDSEREDSILVRRLRDQST